MVSLIGLRIRAVDKFLEVAWKRNPINGDANFDIDGDKKKSQLDFFEPKSLTKIEEFQNALEEKIKSAKEVTNVDLFLFTLEKGHPASQANNHLRNLKKENKIDYIGISPKINYKSLNNKEDLVKIIWRSRQ